MTNIASMNIICSLGDTATRTTLMLAHALFIAKADILRLGSLLFCATHSSEVPVLRSSVMEDRVTRIENKFDELSSKFDQLALTLQAVAQPSIEATQRASETSVPNQAPQEESVPDQAFAPEAPAPQSADAPELAAGSTLGQATAAQPCPVDVQAEYAAIRDAYQRVKLPPDLRLNDSRSGLRRQDQAQFNALVKSARFVETGFKVLAQMKADDISSNVKRDLDSLFAIHLAHMRYIQNEYSSLIVQGNFDPTTSRLFRQLQRESSGLTGEAIENLQRAAGVTGERVRGASGSGRTTPAGGSGPDRRQQSERTYAAVYPRARRSGWRYGSVSRKSRKMCYRI